MYLLPGCQCSFKLKEIEAQEYARQKTFYQKLDGSSYNFK